MAIENSTLSPAPLIPKFATVFNEIARKSGLVVTTGIDGDGDLILVWSGKRSQMRKTGLLTAAYEFPRSGRGVDFKNAWISGRMFPEKNAVRAHIYMYGTPLEIKEENGVEVVRCAEAIFYHSTKNALITLGVCTEKDLPVSPKRFYKALNRSYEDKQSCIYRLPDGTFLLEIETDDAHAERQKKHEEWQRSYQSRLQGNVEPQSVEQFREERTEKINMLMISLLDAAGWNSDESGPFAFPEDVIDQALTLARDVVSLFKNCPVETRRSPINLGRIEKASAAQSDAAFQRFIGKLQGQHHAS